MTDSRLDKMLSLAEQQHSALVQQGKQRAELGTHVGLLDQAVAQLLGEDVGVPVQGEGAEPPRVDLDGNPY